VKGIVVNNVRERRVEAGLTQEQLGDLAGVSRQSVLSIERGRYVPSLVLALRLARIFGCSTDALFRLEGED
jgi:putative transcriptional regulator